MRAGPANRHETLRKELLAAAVATGTGNGAAAWFRAFPLTARTGFELRNLDFHRLSERRLFEGQSQVVAEVVAFHRPAAASATAALLAENVAETENLAEQIAQIHGGGIEARATAHSGKSLMAVSVVCGALLRVREYAVSFGGFLELLLGGMVAGIPVGMELESELTVGALQFLIARPAFDAQNLVIIAFCHRHCFRFLKNFVVLGINRYPDHRGPQQFAFEEVAALEFAED